MRLAEYTEQAQVTNWPERLALIAVFVGLIGLALWGMRRGWLARQRRQSDIPAPMDAPGSDWQLGTAVEGLFAGTGIQGDWMDRIAVHDLGIRSRGRLSFGPEGIWIERDGARSLAIPTSSIVAIRADRGVAGTVRAKDSMVVITWHLGDRVLDTGFRADESTDHTLVLDGLMAAFSTGVQ